MTRACYITVFCFALLQGYSQSLTPAEQQIISTVDVGMPAYAMKNNCR